MPCFVALVLASPLVLAFQDAAHSPSEVDPTTLTLDELIDRLPRVGEDYGKLEGVRSPLVPLAAEMRKRIERGDTLSDEQWQRALTRTGALRWRARWPVTELFAVSMRPPSWLAYTRIELRPSQKELEGAAAGQTYSADCGFSAALAYEDALYQELGSLSIEARALPFELRLTRGRERSPFFDRARIDTAKPESKIGRFHSGGFSLQVEPVATLDEAIPPVHSQELDLAVAHSLWLRFEPGGDDRPRGFLVVATDLGRDLQLAHVGLSLVAELRERGELRETVLLLPETFDERVAPEPGMGYAFYPLETLPVGTETDAAARAAWTVRVRGTPWNVLRLWGAETRWSGEVELGVDELLAHARERNPEGRSVSRPR